MAVIGYMGGITVALITSLPDKLKVIYFTYFFSGVLILVFNKLLKIKASGHACGVVGPMEILVYCLGPWALLGMLILSFVYWASLKMERHTVSQLWLGSVIPVVALFISYEMYHMG